jgi:hypothetical protein
VVGAGWDTDDGGRDRGLLAELPVLQGQLVDDADEGFAVGAEFGELVLVRCAEFLEFHDLFA